MKHTPHESDLISEHGVFVRRLASALTRCEADADDLAQGTWIEALTRPPGEWSSPRGWLSRVMHRRLAKRRRADQRRSAREHRVARKERVEADLDLSLVLGELAGALQELDPELRRVVIGRYFEGLELGELARREGVGLTTVKARLKRAHSELRSRLDRAGGGDRQRWMLALAPLTANPIPAPLDPSPTPSISTTSTLTTGVLAVSIYKAATVLILVGSLLFAITQLGESTQPEARGGLVGEESEQVETVEVMAPDIETERRVLEQDEPMQAETEVTPAAALATLNVHVSDLFGVPARSVSVYAAPAGLPLNYIGTTDMDGSIPIEWLPAGNTPLVVGVKSEGRWLGGLRRFSISAGQSKQYQLSVHPDLLPNQVGDHFSVDVGRARATLHYVDSAREGKILQGLILPQVDSLAAIDSEPMPHRSGPMHPYPRLDEATGGTLFSAFGPMERMRDMTGMLVTVMLWPAPDSGPCGKLVGSVRDRWGQPVAFTRVRAVGDQTEGEETTIPEPVVKDVYTDLRGEFTMELPAGEYEVSTEAKASESSSSKVRVEESGHSTWHGFIEPGVCLVGAIDFAASPGEGEKDAESESNPSIMIEATSIGNGSLWVGVTLAQEDGGFFLPRCASSLLKVQFVLLEDGLVLHSEERALTGQHDWRIGLDPSNRTAVTWSPQDGEGLGPAATELRVWDGDMQRARIKRVGGRIGQPARVSLAPGTWFLEMGSAGACTAAPIRVEVLAGEPLELGPIGMGPVAWLKVPAAPSGQEWVVIGERTDGSRFTAYEGRGPTGHGAESFAPSKQAGILIGERADGRLITVHEDEGTTGDGTESLEVAVPPGTYRVQQRTLETEEGEEPVVAYLGTLELAPMARQVLPTSAPKVAATEH